MTANTIFGAVSIIGAIFVLSCDLSIEQMEASFLLLHFYAGYHYYPRELPFGSLEPMPYQELSTVYYVLMIFCRIHVSILSWVNNNDCTFDELIFQVFMLGAGVFLPVWRRFCMYMTLLHDIMRVCRKGDFVMMAFATVFIMYAWITILHDAIVHKRVSFHELYLTTDSEAICLTFSGLFFALVAFYFKFVLKIDRLPSTH